MVKEQAGVQVDELKMVKKENRKRRKVIEAYQEMMNAGATGLHPVSFLLLLLLFLLASSHCNVEVSARLSQPHSLSISLSLSLSLVPCLQKGVCQF